jgi:hypothetical protein
MSVQCSTVQQESYTASDHKNTVLGYYIDKKENKIFLTYRETGGSGAKAYMYEEGLPNI